MRLGDKQLGLLKGVGTNAALVVGNKVSQRLCALGLMEAAPDGSFAHLTANGLRALADAVDAGRVTLFKLPERQP